MEENLSRAGIISGGDAYGSLDLQGPFRVHQPGPLSQTIHPQHHARPHHNQGSSMGFPLTIGTVQNYDQTSSIGDRSKASASDEEEEPSFAEEGVDGQSVKGKKASPWQRVKWTDKMVRLMITAVSYIGEDAASEGASGGRKKFAALQKKGKWKSVSKVMAERGYHVSPQQCEDKFNDLNKRYKKLNDMLGRGTSCQVVENPALLNVIDYLTEKEKDDVRKILSSKHLFYEEMCSYHNGNRLHLPHDRALQRSLQMALRSRDDHDIDDARRYQHDELDEDDPDVEMDDHDDIEDNHACHDGRGMYGITGLTKRTKQCQSQVDITSKNWNKGSYPHPQMTQTDLNHVLPYSARVDWLHKHWIESRSLQLEVQKQQIQLEMLELEKQRFKWERFSRKRDRVLEDMRMENERMRLENKRMALELRPKKMSLDFN